jgi:hypothetical protein
VFSLRRKSLKLILARNPFSRWFCHTTELVSYFLELWISRYEFSKFESEMNLEKNIKGFLFGKLSMAKTRTVGPHAQCVWPARPSGDEARPGPARPIMQRVDGPHHRQHGVQCVRSACPGAAARRRARDVAWAKPGDGWLVDVKVSMGRIHGPRCDDAARCWPWKRTEGVGRRRGRSSPPQRRRDGSPAGKVGV